jgi:ABC-type glucose/galactose transport system permease subunit
LLQLPWALLPVVGPIRVSTVIASGVMVVAVLWRRHSPFIAVVAVMAWLSAYEILFQATGAVMHGWNASYFAWMSAAVGGWVVLGIVKGVVPTWRWLIPVALVWLIWILTGFNSNSPTAAGTAGFPLRFSIIDEVVNELSKTLLAIAYLAAALRPPVRKR